MTDKIEETIKEIAAKHGIAVGRDDPILILQTINDRLMLESTAAQQANLDAFKSELEEIAYRWGEDARAKAERTLNAALTASKAAMTESIKEHAKTTAIEVRKQVEEIVTKELEPAIKDARRVSYMSLITAGMLVFAAAIGLYATL